MDIYVHIHWRCMHLCSPLRFLTSMCGVPVMGGRLTARLLVVFRSSGDKLVAGNSGIPKRTCLGRRKASNVGNDGTCQACEFYLSCFGVVRNASTMSRVAERVSELEDDLARVNSPNRCCVYFGHCQYRGIDASSTARV